jgi:hypothetical protein
MFMYGYLDAPPVSCIAHRKIEFPITVEDMRPVGIENPFATGAAIKLQTGCERYITVQYKAYADILQGRQSTSAS